MRNKHVLVLAAGVLGLTLSACSKDLTGSDQNATGIKPLQSMDRAMKADEFSFLSPTLGGLIGSLYIQPRATMIAQDTETVGCGQKGNGALGLDNYLNQPSWVTQDILLQEIYVPTRNFLLGFDALNTEGTTQSVKSFFAVKAEGYFMLDAADTDGDYQFAIIADDSARLISTASGREVLVDNEKPTGMNTTCLDKTQPAHMSCTNNWSDQSAAKVRTVHLRKGDALPIEFQYWQGPGQGISMMGFYRKVPAGGVSEAACGKELGFTDGSTSLNNVLSTWKPIRLENLGNYTSF